MNLEAFPPVIFGEGNSPSVQRLRGFRAFSRAQLQTLALYTNRRRNYSSAVLQSAFAGNFVEYLGALRIDILR